MRKRVINLILGFLPAVSLPAQIMHRPITAAYIGAGIYCGGSTDVFSAGFNQAALARLSYASAGVYAERKFLLSELNNYMAVAGLPTSSGNFGINTSYFGFSDYNETKLGLAYGRKLGDHTDMGAQFNYHSIRASGYGNASTISFEAGMINHLSAKLHTGIHLNNPVGGKFGYTHTEKLPSVYSFGLGYEVSPKCCFTAEIIKEENEPVNIHAGFQYRFLLQAMVRAGISTATSSIWFGLSLSSGRLRMDITTTYHPQLGISPGLLLLFHAKENKK